MTHLQEAGDAWEIAYTLLYRGTIEFRQENHQETVRLQEESVARYRKIGDVFGRRLALTWLVSVGSSMFPVLRDARGSC